MKTQTATKQVQVLNRYELKNRTTREPNGYIVYQVKSSDGARVYETTLKDGIAKSCTCPATKPCYHMVQLQEREASRIAQEQERDTSREVEKQAYWEYEFQCGYYNHPWA